MKKPGRSRIGVILRHAIDEIRRVDDEIRDMVDIGINEHYSYQLKETSNSIDPHVKQEVDLKLTSKEKEQIMNYVDSHLQQMYS